MKKITYSLTLAQYKSEVPAAIKGIYRVIGFLSAIWVIIGLQIHVPAATQAAVATWLLIGNKMLYEFCQFFGYAQPDISNGEKSTAKNTDTSGEEKPTTYS